MSSFSLRLRQLCTAVLLVAWLPLSQHAQQISPAPSFPSAEKLTYRVEWRLIMAGTSTIQLSKSPSTHGWDFTINVESAGLVSRLYHILDKYKVSSNDQFCGINANLDAQEGKKHALSNMVFDNSAKQLSYEERDLSKPAPETKHLEIDACTYEIAGALASLRLSKLDPGKSIKVAITDGKKFVHAKIEAQAKENLTVAGKSYSTTRYEAFLFDNMLYKKRGRLLIWISDDPDRLPVELRVLMGFPIGTITIELQSHERF